jgi:hypothetical protein
VQVLTSIVTYLLEIGLGIVLLLCATIVFDVIHVLLHRLAHSHSLWLARVGALHMVHHEFLDQDLCIHEDKLWANVFHHVVPEFVVQLIVTAALAPLFPMVSVVTALAIEGGAFLFIMWGNPGIDVNHKQVEQLKAYQPLYFCVPEYHLLHHVYPDAHFSSWIKALDHFLGTGLSLCGRKVLMTDTASALPNALRDVLQHADCIVNSLDVNEVTDLTHCEAALRETAILLLCHSASAENYSRWTKHFYELHQADRFPVEVWALDQCDDLAVTRQWFSAGKVIYRLLLADDQKSSVKNAQRLLHNLRRGLNFVPASFSPVLMKRYGQFVLK